MYFELPDFKSSSGGTLDAKFRTKARQYFISVVSVYTICFDKIYEQNYV